MEDVDDGLWEESALKPLVPAGVTVCDETGAAGFWATSVPAAHEKHRKSEKFMLIAK